MNAGRFSLTREVTLVEYLVACARSLFRGSRMVLRGSPPPGTYSDASDERLEASTSDPSVELWDGYLEDPSPERVGICCSGGGIRSASFSLGALQVLRDEGLLFDAEYLASASGGGYIAIAHTVLVSETLRHAAEEHVPAEPVEDDEPPDLLTLEHAFFSRQAPWAGGSPEEQHLRNRLKYLGSGPGGWIWLALNLLYGMIRHLLPFFAVFYSVGFALGWAMHRWIGCALRIDGPSHCAPGSHNLRYGELVSFLYPVVGLLVLALLLLAIRNYGQTHEFRDGTMAALEYLPIVAILLGVIVFIGLIGIPATLLWLHSFKPTLWRDLNAWTQGFTLVGLAGAISTAATFVIKNASNKWFKIATGVLVALSAPILILVPVVGFTYWNAQWGPIDHDLIWRWFLAGLSIFFIALFWTILNEVTSIPHLFYRERLASTFIGYRKRGQPPDPPGLLRHAQPSWRERLKFSQVVPGSTPHARIPNLVVCAAVNLSGDLPAGRLGASFTFERDRVGGPATGYVKTTWMEEKENGIAMTMPGLMAISGAAVSPAMGKGTFPALRFALAFFDLRLGVWLPNPHREMNRLYPWQIRQGQPFLDASATKVARPRRPGALYVFREAFGLNSLRNRFVYVTDGGHWENLGLVELLRRGCMRIVCVDCSGGDTENFATLAEAIALARADLGVDITIDLSDLHRKDGVSEKGYALGCIKFPDSDEIGVLMYIPSVIPKHAPHDVIAYSKHDKKFPNNPTTDQFFKEQTFEAYRALARYNMAAAIAEHGAYPLPPQVPPPPPPDVCCPC